MRKLIAFAVVAIWAAEALASQEIWVSRASDRTKPFENDLV